MGINVLVSSASYSLTDHFSASEGLAAYHIMKGLGRHDVNFHAIAANVLINDMPTNLRTYEVSVPADKTLIGNDLLTLVTGTYYLARNYLRSLTILRREDIDIVHHMFPSNNVNFSLVPLLSRVGDGCPYVFGPICGPDPIDNPYHKLFAKFHDANCRHATAVIVQTRELKDTYSDRFGDDKVFMIPLGVEPDYFETYPEEVHSGFEIVTVGNLRTAKGLDYLIRAMAEVVKEHKDAHLTIVGDGPERQNLELLIEELNLQGHIALTGFVPREDLKGYYRRADLFCLASMNEVFGKVLIEAMACGKPVVSTIGPGPKQIVEEGRTGMLVRPRDAGSLAKAIGTVASDPELRRRMSSQARSSAQMYNWDNIIERYWDVYRAILEK